MSQEELDQLLSENESMTVEFKAIEILSNPVKMAIEMTALANTAGGVLLLGVDDDKTLEGIQYKKGHEEQIMNIARDKCDPPLAPKFSVVSKNGMDVYFIRISRYRFVPHAAKTDRGKVHFIRAGSTVREASAVELKQLFAEAAEEAAKTPDLELFLIDESGNKVGQLELTPTFEKITYVERVKPNLTYFASLESIARFGYGGYSPFQTHEPAENLVPIRIGITNNGEAPAFGIRIFMEFPKGSKVASKDEAIGGMAIGAFVSASKNIAGLFESDKDEVAIAHIDTLGNDLTITNFDEIYVRFPEADAKYDIVCRVIQHRQPPREFHFPVTIKPKFKEVTKFEDERNSIDETENGDED